MSWQLTERFAFDGDEIAWQAFGDGQPLVLVHGFPSNSYLWRDVIPVLSRDHLVYVFDLRGFGLSSKREGQDVFIPAQARVLAALVEHWALDEPLVAGHDIGAATTAWAHVEHGVPFRRIALISAAMLNPCITENTRHVQAHLSAYETMPAAVYSQILRTQISSADYGPMRDADLEAYMRPWLGEQGQAAYFRFVSQIDEAVFDETERIATAIDVPVRIVWGDGDTWIPSSHGDRLAELIPDARLTTVPEAGHFITDEAASPVSGALADFFAGVATSE